MKTHQINSVCIRELETIDEIKQAVKEGKVVYSDSIAYRVVKDIFNVFWIIHEKNNYTTALHGLGGTEFENKLNGTTFFYFDK